MESIIGQLIIALTLLSQTLSSHPLLAQTVEASTLSTTTPITIEIPVTEEDKVLNAISHCESRDRQFNPDGSIFRGIVNSKDVGKFQINEFYHLEMSKKLEMNIYTLEGNTSYAKWLYETEGTQPWNASKYCWSKLIVDD